MDGECTRACGPSPGDAPSQPATPGSSITTKCVNDSGGGFVSTFVAGTIRCHDWRDVPGTSPAVAFLGPFGRWTAPSTSVFSPCAG